MTLGAALPILTFVRTMTEVPMSDADLQRQIRSELKPAGDELAAESEAAKTRMQAIVNALSDAIRAKNAPLIRQHLGALDRLMGDYAGLVTRGRTLVARIGKLRPEDERSNAAKALAGLAKLLGERQARLDGNYDKLKEMQALANRTLGEADSASARLRRAWADMEAFLATNGKLYATRLEQMALLEKTARGAVADRDPAALATMQARADDRKNWKPTVSEINSRLIAFFAENGDKLAPHLREQFTRDRIQFNKTMEGLQATDKRIEAHQKAIKALTIAPVDPKKAADAMQIPKGNEAKVKKALESGHLLDGLDALARELKLSVNGTDLLGRLKKARLVTP